MYFFIGDDDDESGVKINLDKGGTRWGKFNPPGLGENIQHVGLIEPGQEWVVQNQPGQEPSGTADKVGQIQPK